MTAVKQTKLDQYRIVYFATHALVSGETEQAAKGMAEPALVLSLPATATAFDDGLLTSSEVAQLKLNADWVVLSACNTAAADKPGAEALSGLARAFIYAGARALLVSHWPVESEPAVKLMTTMFATIAENPKLTTAEALRQAMLTTMDDRTNPEWANPTLLGTLRPGWRRWRHEEMTVAGMSTSTAAAGQGTVCQTHPIKVPAVKRC